MAADWADEKAAQFLLEATHHEMSAVQTVLATALREAEARGKRKASSRMTSIFEDEGRGHVTVALKPRMIQRLDELQEATGVMSRSDVIKNALLVYEAYVRSRKKKGLRALAQEGREG